MVRGVSTHPSTPPLTHILAVPLESAASVRASVIHITPMGHIVVACMLPIAWRNICPFCPSVPACGCAPARCVLYYVQWSLRDVESATMALYTTITGSVILHTVSGPTG